MARNVRLVTGPSYAPQDRAAALADALTARSLRNRAPEQMGRVAVEMSPWEGIAQLGEAFLARKATNYVDRLAAAEAERQRTANDTMVRQLSGEPAAPRRLNEQGQPVGEPVAVPTDIETGQPMLVSDKAQRLAAAIAGQDPRVANQVLSAETLRRALSESNLERVDLGDSIGLVDAGGNVVQRIPKGATPDAQLRERGEQSRFDGVSGSARISAETARRGQDISANTARRSQDVTMRGQDLSYEATLRGQQATADKAGAERDAAAQAKAREVENVWNMYQSARAGMLAGLERTETGPIIGRMTAITAGQQTAEGGVAAMAPVLKQLFRVSGEGVFTDRDQALLLDMVPKRTDLPEARAQKIQNIDAIVRAKLGMSDAQPNAGMAGEWSEDDALIQKYLGGQ